MRPVEALLIVVIVGGVSASTDPTEPPLHAASPSAARWTLVQNWPSLPPGFQLGEVSGVSIDSRGHVFAFHRSGRGFDRDATDPISVPTVLELAPDTGRLLSAWGAGLFLIPHSLTVDRQDNVWLTDVGRHQVFKFSRDGRPLLEVGERGVPGWDASHFNEPTDVAVAADGSFFVSDGYMNARIAHFDPAGRFLNEWGTKGTKPGQFEIPHGLALDTAGRLYVADRQNSRLQVFDATGAFLRVWPAAPSVGRVFAVATGSNGFLYMARKDGPEAVRILDPAFRDAGVLPSGVGGLVTPHAIAVRGDRLMYIADTTGKRLCKFVKE